MAKKQSPITDMNNTHDSKSKTDEIKVSFRISRNLKELINTHSTQVGETESTIIRAALTFYLESFLDAEGYLINNKPD